MVEIFSSQLCEFHIYSKGSNLAHVIGKIIFFCPEFHTPVIGSHEPGTWKEEKMTDYGQVPAREEREVSESLPLWLGGWEKKERLERQ